MNPSYNQMLETTKALLEAQKKQKAIKAHLHQVEAKVKQAYKEDPYYNQNEGGYDTYLVMTLDGLRGDLRAKTLEVKTLKQKLKSQVSQYTKTGIGMTKAN